MLPEQFDVLSFREILLVIQADDDHDLAEWQRAAFICTYVRNWSPNIRKGHQKQPEELFPELFDRRKMIEDPEIRMQRSLEREAEFLAMVAKKEARLEREAKQVK